MSLFSSAPAVATRNPHRPIRYDVVCNRTNRVLASYPVAKYGERAGNRCTDRCDKLDRAYGAICTRRVPVWN